MPSSGYKIILLGIIVTLFSWATVSTAQKPETKDFKEGANVVVNCNVTKGPTGYAFWTNDKGQIWEGTILNITNVTRAYKGDYRCIYQNISIVSKKEMEIEYEGKEVYSFYLNVLYLPHVVVINGSNNILGENKTFWMYVNVTGNPGPITTFTYTSSGMVYFTADGEGLYNITVPSLNCSNTGQYELRCDNTEGNTSQIENVFVLCPPIPNPEYKINNTVTPRLRQHVNITVHVIGYPQPNYTWMYEGKGPLPDHIDNGYTTVLLLKDILLQDYGDYTLVMENDQGKNSVYFTVIEDGPPDPVTSLTVSYLPFTSANLSFITGYDYNSTQTFIVQRKVEGKLIEFRNKTGDEHDFGGKQEYILITDLDEFTDYNLTITSRNLRGDSAPSELFVNFSTSGTKPIPDPNNPPVTKHKPRLGENISLTIHALHAQKFRWEHDGMHINSTDQADQSDVYITSVAVDDFGEYTLNMSNKVGYNIVVYNLLADGPPEPVSQLSVSNISNSTAQINFLTGYNYNDTQTFMIMSFEDGNLTELSSCLDTTSGDGGKMFYCKVDKLMEDILYNVTVIAKNTRGNSTPSSFLTFTTYGKPKPDDSKHDNDTFTPRLHDVVTMTIHSLGYPPPKYEWWHNGLRLNSSDTNYTSTLTVEILDGKAFGEYILNMSNEVGYFSEAYHVLAEGPPAAVSDVKVSNITDLSASLSFISGYDFNDTQTFIVLNYTDGEPPKEIEAKQGEIHDNGGTPVIMDLDLKSLTYYNITVIANNSRGKSEPAQAFLNFTSLGKPAHDPNHKDNLTAAPRLGANITLMYHAIGNPLPNFRWYHNNKLLNHTNTGAVSSLPISNFTVDNFGTYTLTMTNIVGEINATFDVKEDGPPEPARDLVAGDVKSDSVALYWRPGFNYGSDQKFTIISESNGVSTPLKDGIPDKTDGDLSKNETVTLDGLSSSTNYTIYVQASNARGTAYKHSNTISFKTADSDGGGTTAEIVGYVVGGIGFVVLVLVIISLIRCYMARRSRNLPSERRPLEQEGEDQPREPHHYSYDDAAST